MAAGSPAPSHVPPSPPGDHRPALAVIAEELTPYRLHLHRRLAREIPEVRLWSVMVGDPADSPWHLMGDAEIGVVHLALGERARRRGRISAAAEEWQVARAVWRWLDERSPAALHVGGYYSLPLLATLAWGIRRRVPVLLMSDANIHSDWARGVRRLAKKLFLRLLLPRCAAILPFGSLGRAFYLAYGAPDERIFLSPCEPDYDALHAVPNERVERVARQLGLAPDRRRILVCGRLIRIKRPDVALNAFLAIADERPQWDLVFAGDGPMRAELAARVPARFRHRVHLAGFIRDMDDLAALYRLCQVLLHPAEYEPWALVINEAVAVGLAVVASDVVGAVADLVEDGVNGRICAVGDVGAFTAALREVTDETTLARMQAAAPEILARWRRRADPVAGVRAALASAGVLPRGATPAGSTSAPGTHLESPARVTLPAASPAPTVPAASRTASESLVSGR